MVSAGPRLREGTIRGAVIDILDVGPPPPDHPLVADDIPNLIVMPHSAQAGHQVDQNVVDETAASIRALLARRPAQPHRLKGDLCGRRP